MKLGQGKKDIDFVSFTLQKPPPRVVEAACKDGGITCIPPTTNFRALDSQPGEFGGRFCVDEEAFDPEFMIDIRSWSSIQTCEEELEKEIGDCCVSNMPVADALVDTCYSVSTLEECAAAEAGLYGSGATFVWNMLGKRKWVEVGLEATAMCEERCGNNSSSGSEWSSSSSSSSSSQYSGFKCPPQSLPVCECGFYTVLDETGCPNFLCRNCSSSTADRCPEAVVPQCDCGHAPILDSSNCLSYGCIACPEDPQYPINPGYPTGATPPSVLVPNDDTLLPPYDSSTSSLFIEIPAVPVYFQTSVFGKIWQGYTNKKLPNSDVTIFVDMADGGGMTNDNRYDSTYAVAQTMLDKWPSPNEIEEYISASYYEPIEFTHVRFGPPPCHVYESSGPYITGYASGAINGNPNEDFTACDGSFYIGASIQYGLTSASYTNLNLVGNTTNRVFLDANKKIVRNEYVGDYTVKNASVVKVSDNGNFLAIAEFIPVFISDRMITILTQPDFVSVENGARFEAKVVAEITYGEMEYKWQMFRMDPATSTLKWMDVFGEVGISGEDTDTLVVTPDIPEPNGMLEYSWNGSKFRCVITAPRTLTKKSVEVTFVMPYIVYGCTDPDAQNYNPNAQVDDGSCVPQT